MSRTQVACAVCLEVDRPGSYSQKRDTFICTSCQADAKQFMEIQDSMWPVAGGTGRPGDETGHSQPAPPSAD